MTLKQYENRNYEKKTPIIVRDNNIKSSLLLLLETNYTRRAVDIRIRTVGV